MRSCLIGFLLLLVVGCNGVYLNKEYSTLLDRTAALSDRTADLAERGRLTQEQMTEALREQAKTWEKFRDARDGEK